MHAMHRGAQHLVSEVKRVNISQAAYMTKISEVLSGVPEPLQPLYREVACLHNLSAFHLDCACFCSAHLNTCHIHHLEP